MTETASKATAEAISEIGQLVQQYAHAADIHGPEAQGACFTEDGYIVLSSLGRRSRSEMTGPMPPGGPVRRHFFTPPLIDFSSDDTATGRGYCLILEFDDGAQKPPYSVDYSDEYRRTNAGWRLASRVISRSFGPT